MQTVQIAVAYHSQYGHTAQLADVIADNLIAERSEVSLVDVGGKKIDQDILNNADTIIFGCPTYFGTVSAVFKTFMESTASVWYKQPWKNKLAAGFTTSSTTNGDKLLTLVTLASFAAQHGMIWISQGILPRFINDVQTDGQNRMGSYLGMMGMTDNSIRQVNPLHPGDFLTAELFAKRILDVTLRAKGIIQTS